MLKLVALCLVALSQDKTKKLTPAQVVGESIKTLKKAPHFMHAAAYKTPQFTGAISGDVKKDVHIPLEGPEIWAKGTASLVKAANGRYVPPANADFMAEEGRAVTAFRNPAVMLAEIESAAAQIPPERRPDEANFAVIVVTLTADAKKALLKNLVGRIALPIPIPNPDQFVDIDKTFCRYVLWINTADLSLEKYKFELQPAAKKGNVTLPGLPVLDVTTWGSEISAEISLKDAPVKPVPVEVGTKLGIK